MSAGLNTVFDSHDTDRNRELAVRMPALLDTVSPDVLAIGGPTTTAERIAASVPANTRRALERIGREWVGWCNQLDRRAMPADGQTLADFISDRINVGPLDAQGRRTDGLLSPGMLTQLVFGIRRLHAEAGHHGEPDTAKARDVIRWWKTKWAGEGYRERIATPLVGDDLAVCLEQINGDEFTAVRARALLLLGFAGFLRRSELAALRLSDVDYTPQGLTLHIRVAKTGVGQAVDLIRGKRQLTDPVGAYTALASAVRDHADRSSDHLFWRLDRWGNIPAPLSDHSVNVLVRDAVEAAGLPDPTGYTGHSLRAGGATTAYASGVAIETIRRHGRWSQNSTAMFRYFRAVDRWRDNASGGLGL